MRLTWLGTGAAGGVPLYGCNCPACSLAQTDHAFVRKPCCALIETASTRILIDAGVMDLHERFAPGSLTAIVLTHFHPDHVQGLLHMRWGTGLNIPVFCPPDPEGCADLYKHPGILQFKPVEKFQPWQIGDISLTALPLIHSKMCFGYRLSQKGGSSLAYLTDTTGLPDKTISYFKEHPVDWTCVDATDPPGCETRPKKSSHNDVLQALECAGSTGALQVILTHLSHRCDAWLMSAEGTLPAGVAVARDGQQVLLSAAR